MSSLSDFWDISRIGELRPEPFLSTEGHNYFLDQASSKVLSPWRRTRCIYHMTRRVSIGKARALRKLTPKVGIFENVMFYRIPLALLVGSSPTQSPKCSSGYARRYQSLRPSQSDAVWAPKIDPQVCTHLKKRQKSVISDKFEKLL